MNARRGWQAGKKAWSRRPQTLNGHSMLECMHLSRSACSLVFSVLLLQATICTVHAVEEKNDYLHGSAFMSGSASGSGSEEHSGFTESPTSPPTTDRTRPGLFIMNLFPRRERKR